MSTQHWNDDLVSIVIPAYNEEATLSVTVAELLSALRGAGVRSELVIVNDGSSDATAAVISHLETVYPEVKGCYNAPKHGYGYAVRCGIENATGGTIAIVMADGSDTPADLLRYLELIKQGYGCAFGSRFRGSAKVENYPGPKMVINRLGNFIMAKLAKSDYDDFTNGFKAYRRSVIDGMQPLRSGQFNLTVEMSMKAVRSGSRFAVTANNWKQREAGASNFNVIKQSFLYLVTIHWVLTGSARFLGLIEKAARVDGTEERLS